MIESYLLSEDEINYILNLQDVIDAKVRVDNLSNSGVIHFSITLPDSLKQNIGNKIGGIDLTRFNTIPMRWIKGDTPAHNDRCVKAFDKTYLAYLTNSEGNFIVDGDAYAIAKGNAYVFSEGLMHETIGTGMEPRLLLGPMSEEGLSVGAATNIQADGQTEIIYFKYVTSDPTFGTGIIYKINDGGYNGISLPVTITNTNTNYTLQALFENDLIIDSSLWYFICGSNNIQFGSTSLNNDGSRPIITIDGVLNYPGLISNGASGASGNNNIYVYNLEVRTTNGSTLLSDAGWVGHSYFGKGASNNYIVNCSSSGPIIDAGGGIIGGYSGSESGASLYIIGCSSSGATATYSGGIIGFYAGRNGGAVTCESCWSTGAISGANAGGIFGYEAANTNGFARAFKCYSFGAISGDNAGGIFGALAGTSASTEAEACYSQGAISGAGYGSGTGAGGIYGSGAGSDGGTSIATNCYSWGLMTSQNFDNENGIFSGGTSGENRQFFNCYSANDNWSNIAANALLSGTPNYPTTLIGTSWAATGGADYPYELNGMGYTPYSLTNIVTSPTPALQQTYTQTIQKGQTSVAAIIPGHSYDIFKISGGTPSSYATITMNDNTGIISSTTASAAGTYTITLRNTGSYNFTTFELTISEAPAPISDICFPAGTPIQTDQGIIAIDKINTAIHTIRNRKIEGVVMTKLNNNYLVCFEKNALGFNVPCRRTIMSANHLVSYEGQMKKAKEFLNHFNSIHKVKYNGEMMYNVLMEKHEVILVNNMVCETLDPSNTMAKIFYSFKNISPEQQKIIVDKMNQEVFNKMHIRNSIIDKKTNKMNIIKLR
jgi:hypothetical protein